jgi:hypothetical protein
MPQARQWIDWPEDLLPLWRYSSLVAQAQVRLSDVAGADGGAWEVKQEEFIADCMKREGFTYHPRAVETAGGQTDLNSSAAAGLWVPWLPEDLADVERYGYGYWDAGGSPSQALPTEGSAQVDPNDDYVGSLSAPARKEYMVALMGAEMAEYDLADAAEVPVPELGGCMGGANQKHPQPMMEALDESPITAYQDLIDQMGEQATSVFSEVFLRRAQADALNAEWRECFEKSFSLAGPPAPAGVEQGVTKSGPTGSVMFDGPAGAWHLALSTNADGEYWDSAAGQAPDEYGSLTGTAREVAIAVADYNCRQAANYVDRLGELLHEAQEQFLAEHRAELDEMASALEQYVG